MPATSRLVLIVLAAGCAIERVEPMRERQNEQRAAEPAAPARGIGDARVVQLVGDADDICVLLDDGEVACWGEHFGEVPGRIAGLGGATAIALGQEHLCVLHEDHTASCGGSNKDGQLGREDPQVGLPFARVDGLGEVTAVFVGGHDTCVRGTGPGLLCWGRSFPRKEDGDSRVALYRNHEIVAAGVADYDHVALTTTGEVSWWGLPRYFASHDGRYHAWPEAPAPVQLPGRARDGCAGPYHSCAVVEAGTVHCWGNSGVFNQRLGFEWPKEWSGAGARARRYGPGRSCVGAARTSGPIHRARACCR
ncbi:hypothetical protein OV203_20960 [Nannocystis sp. ILAH1]|uniref:RCC1 domain-containing protein n=1 Tax=Nannocystis sp. ILAH1 TaxID=2996789 RepID=UPI0022714DE6|nr:hypothetical protein [Nannocystis sp. ILAH1]MCY0989621.1 hypothetical protein [Nannocystis sp. ILAH1]